MRDRSIVDGVVALVEQSLVRQMPGVADEPRYQMLETVREFGLEQVTLAGELDDARARHAQHVFTLSARVVQGMQIFMPLESLSRVAPEQDNARLALAWFDDHDEIAALMGLSSLLMACGWRVGSTGKDSAGSSGRWSAQVVPHPQPACRPSWRRGCWRPSKATTLAPRH